MTAIRCFVLVFLSLAASPLFAQPESKYFGHINAVCATESDCREVRRLLRKLEYCEDGKKCATGNTLLGKVFGIYVPTLPKVIVYLEQCQETGAASGYCTPSKDGKFSKRTPVLMYDRQRTAHVYGARQVYALVFAERKTCVSAHVTLNYRSEPNPLSLILSAVSSVKLDAAAAKASESKQLTFKWYPLSGNYDPKAPGLWVGLAGVPIDENTVNWMTIEPGNPRPKPGQGEPAIPPECVGQEGADEIELRTGPQVQKENVGARKLFNELRELKPGSDATLVLKDQQLDIRTGQSRNPNASKPAADGGAKPEASKSLDANFVAADAFFSNSPGGRATMAIALGWTKNTKDTSLGTGGSNSSFNGYALVKWYLVKPTLRPLPDSECFGMSSWIWTTYRCPSFGLFAGMNVKNDIFSEIVYGVSIGHIWDNVGLVGGWNSIAGGKNGQEGRQKRPFVGIEYSF